VPLLRAALALLLEAKLAPTGVEAMCQSLERRSQRTEEARFWQYKSTNQLAPRRMHQRR
jgi:hypothetical protein